MPNGFQNSIKSLVRTGVRAASSVFAGGGGSIGSGNGGYGGAARTFFGMSAGSQINWDAVTGDLTQNPIALTCLNIIADNYCQARIRVERRGEDADKYEPDPDHALLPILKCPNPFYSWNYLQRGIIASLHGQGDAYIGIERDGNGIPAELYWIPYGIRPDKLPGSTRLVDRWIYQVQGGKEKFIDLKDVIHIPFGADPRRPGFGMSIAQVLKQDQYILQQGTNYTANVMRNNGTVGGIVTPKEIKDANGNVVRAVIDPKAVGESWRRKTRGDQAGDIMVLDFPVDVAFPKNSPQDLSLDTILDRPESDICAVMRVSILLVGAYGGRTAKTYANFQQARTALWEENLLPLQQTIAAEITTQLLPQMGGDASTERVAYDTSGIRALQPDLDKLHERVRSDFEANLIDLYTAELETKRVPDEKHKGVYCFMLPSVGESGQSADKIVPPQMENGEPDDAQNNAKPPAAIPPPAPKADDKPALPPGAFSHGKSIKSGDGDQWITLEGGRKVNLGDPSTFPPGFTGQHVVDAKTPDKKTKSEIAKASKSITDKTIQRYTENTNEPQLATALDATHLRDNEPVDVFTIKGGVVQHGVELKTMVTNKAGKITMSKSALEKKAKWIQTNKAPLSTVVFDDRKVYNAGGVGKHDVSRREIYYRRGAGSFELTSMHKVPDLASLSELIGMRDSDLPDKARPPKTYVPPPARE